VLKLRWIPQLCSILAIVNGRSPVRGPGFSDGAVNALSKIACQLFRWSIRVAIETKMNLMVKRARNEMRSSYNKVKVRMTGKWPRDVRKLA
jgi:hypothetical protein